MQHPPFNPFEYLSFQKDTCFLTGKKIAAGERYFIPVFPEWLLRRYHLEEAVLTMLNWNKMKYAAMVLPASKEAMEAVAHLDAVTQKAFEQGYDAVVQLPELILFQWMARVMYGVLYQDLIYTIDKRQQQGRSFHLSPLMLQKFKYLHFMLQSLVRPVRFDGFTPWSIHCCRVRVSKDILNYKDETNKLNFCLGMNGFGIVACLQDNGAVARFNQDILEKMGDAVLHPAQFEELYGRFMYTNYILRETPGYPLTEDEDGTLVFHMPEDPYRGMPRFAEWKDDIFAQVLANMWEPWGLPIQKIYTFPNSPVSYLINEFTQELIPFEQIPLDY